MTNDQQPETHEVFSESQRVRGHALRVARTVTGKTGLMTGELTVTVPELIDVADYVVTGALPPGREHDDAT